MHPVTTLTSITRSLRLRRSLARTVHSYEAENPAAAQEPTAARLAPDGSPDPSGEAGMATAEYAIGTLTAAAFAGLLLAVIRSGGIQGILQGIIETALSIG